MANLVHEFPRGVMQDSPPLTEIGRNENFEIGWGPGRNWKMNVQPEYAMRNLDGLVDDVMAVDAKV